MSNGHREWLRDCDGRNYPLVRAKGFDAIEWVTDREEQKAAEIDEVMAITKSNSSWKMGRKQLLEE